MIQTKTKKDAGAASLKKVPTDALKKEIRQSLGLLDSLVHVAKLEAQNRAYWVNADWPERLAYSVEGLFARIRELKSRQKGTW